VHETLTATTERLAPCARTDSPTQVSHPTPSVTAPESALPPIRYVCLTCSDQAIQILGWGRHCWNCTSTRIAPATTIASTHPGVSATELLERWRHLIP